MSDRILRTRIKSLRANLEQVQSVLDSVQAQRQEVEQLKRLLVGKDGHIRKSLSTIQDRLALASMSVNILAKDERLDQFTVNYLAETIRLACETIEESKEDLDAVDQLLANRHSRLTPIDREKGIGLTLQNLLINPSLNWSKRLPDDADELLAELADAQPANGDGDGEQVKEKVGRAWRSYEQWSNEVRPIFTEYVDFLRGLALRDLGFDAGICQIADELGLGLRIAEVQSWDALTIPSREATVRQSVAPIIRLPFSEWRLWALPLVAHEFGYLVIRPMIKEPEKYGPLVRFIEDRVDEGWGRGALLDLFADAFATYTMGPAYAFAAILLRLDPLRAYAESADEAAPDERVTVILEMLRWMDGQSDVEDSYAEIVSYLEQEWRAAVTEAAPAPPPGAPEAGRAETLRRLAQEVGESRFLETVAYRQADWDRIADWRGAMLAIQPQDEVGLGSVKLVDHQLRDLLNAAWYARWQNEQASGAIENVALGMWEQMQERRMGTAVQAEAGPRAPQAQQANIGARGSRR